MPLLLENKDLFFHENYFTSLLGCYLHAGAIRNICWEN